MVEVLLPFVPVNINFVASTIGDKTTM